MSKKRRINDEKVTYTCNGNLELKDTMLGNENWSALGNIGWNGILQYKNLGNSKIEAVMDGELVARYLQQ